jgi:hypothetical protein
MLGIAFSLVDLLNLDARAKHRLHPNPSIITHVAAVLRENLVNTAESKTGVATRVFFALADVACGRLVEDYFNFGWAVARSDMRLRFAASAALFGGLPGGRPVARRRRYQAACREMPSLSMIARISGSRGLPPLLGPFNLCSRTSLSFCSLFSGCLSRLKNAIVSGNNLCLFTADLIFSFALTRTLLTTFLHRRGKVPLNNECIYSINLSWARLRFAANDVRQKAISE